MNNGLSVSVLDLVGMHPNEKPGAAIGRSVDLAQHVERLGYTRYWLAEHHSIAGLACSATSVLIGHIAAATKTIRVGSGGVMLPNHAPLVVAEQFGTLDALYPGRIDLGLGRAPGGDLQTMRALRRDLGQNGDDFPALLNELQTYLGPELPGQLVKAIPGQGSNVPITLLGSSLFSAQLAASLGLPFAFAAHFAPDYLYAAARVYRETFRPQQNFARAAFDSGFAGGSCRNGRGGEAFVYHAATTVSSVDPKSAGGIIAAGRFHGDALAGLGTVCGRKQD
jgi:luciferase family oxidoreductase group 1